MHWEAEIEGLSAHAGMHPEQGISAVAIASLAVADVRAHGWFGRVVKGARRGTSNVGIIQGGRATNEVTDRVVAEGECRSHDPEFLDTIVAAYRKAFDRAAARVTNDSGKPGRVRFHVHPAYPAFRLPSDAPVVE